jgi:hypothetical protein
VQKEDRDRHVDVLILIRAPDVRGSVIDFEAIVPVISMFSNEPLLRLLLGDFHDAKLITLSVSLLFQISHLIKSTL